MIMYTYIIVYTYKYTLYKCLLYYTIFPQTVYCWGSQCCLKCVRLGWDAVSASLVLACSCLPTCLPSWLGCCVRLPGLVRLSLVSGLVSQLVSGLGCCVRVPGLVFSCLRSCLPTCLPSWLGCCVRLPDLVFLLSPVLCPNLSPVWDAASASLVLACSCLRSCLPTCLPSWLGCCVRLSGLVFLLSPVLCPNLSPVCVRLPGLAFSCVRSCLATCLPSWLGCCVRLLVWSCSCLPACLPGCLALVSQLVSHLGWDAVSASLVSSFSCLRSCLPICLRSGMLRPPP